MLKGKRKEVDEEKHIRGIIATNVSDKKKQIESTKPHFPLIIPLNILDWTALCILFIHALTF